MPIPNPWVLLGIGLAWLASLVAVGLWQNKAGVTGERVAWQARENAELVVANGEIQRLNDAARKKEQETTALIAAIGEGYAKDKADIEARAKRDVAAAHAGTQRLRIAGACKGPGASSAPAPGATAGGSDDPTTAELPGAVAADLLQLVNDADQVVVQLTACQSVVTDYLKGMTP